MNKRTTSLAVAAMVAASALAIPARPIKHQVRQTDGTTLTITVRGDENFHFTCTEDGMPVVKNSNGTYCYAKLTSAGIMATSQIAHNAEQRSSEELSFLKAYDKEASAIRSLGKEKAQQRNASRMARLMKRGTVDNQGRAKVQQKDMAGAWGGEGIGVTGKRKGLVILVNFKDKKMQTKHSLEEWKNYFNEEGYSKMGNSGSVHDYFKAQSYGQFDLEFDVVGPVTVSKNMAAYGGNDAYGNDKDPAGMVYEACKLVDSQVNFADYDWDGDGIVDQVYLIYAGYGEASAYDVYPETIWQHEWNLASAGYSLNLDGVNIDTYGCSSELIGYTGTDMDGIGTACHEFSHCLGLPDIYDTDYSGGFGMGNWDVMDAGSYAGDGYKPVGYNTYEKWVSGCMQPTELKSACFVKNLKPLSESPESYIIYNDNTPTEYYLLENRQLKGTDTELPAHGMLVIHVDYSKSAWENNGVNDLKSHQRFTIVPADNTLTENDETGDTYPGTSRNTSLTDESTPAAALFNANSDGRKFLGKPVTEIAESEGQISFTFMGGETINTPQNPTTASVTDNSFTAQWADVEGAESYNLQIRKKSDKPAADEAGKVIEDLTKWGSGMTGDSNSDISSKLDSKMKNMGWTGSKVYECPGMAKLGSSKVAGYLVSPTVSDLSTAHATVRLQAKKYGTDDSQITVSLLNTQGEAVASAQVTADGTMKTVAIENPTENNYKVKIAPKKRCYVEYIGIYDGEFTDDDFADTDKAPKLLLGLKAPEVKTEIKGNTYTFTELEAGDYQWRVQAVKGNVLSDWTLWQDVVIGNPTSIRRTEFSADSMIDVYTVSGTYAGKMTCSDFFRSPLASGTYILKSAHSTVVTVK